MSELNPSNPSNLTASDSEHSDSDDSNDVTTNGDVDGAPEEPDARTNTHAPGLERQDKEVILKAGKKIRGLLVGVLQDLQQHAPTLLTADIKLTIGDRQIFDLRIGNASQDEDRLVVKIIPAAAPMMTDPTETRSKRPAASPSELFNLTAPKRPRENDALQSPPLPAPVLHASGLVEAARQTQHDGPAAATKRPPPPQEEYGSEQDLDPDEPASWRKEFQQLTERV